MWFASEGRRRHWLTWKSSPHMKTGCATENSLRFNFCPRRYFIEHSYNDGGLLNHILDDGKMVNHSDTPNAGASLLDSGVHDEIDEDDDSDIGNGGC